MNAPEVMPCVLCGGPGTQRVLGTKDYFVLKGNSQDFQIWYCVDCRTGFSAPPMTQAQLTAYYPADFEAYSLKKTWMAFLQTLKYRGDIQLLKKISRGTARSLFEIGAGRGEFLAKVQEKGFEADGLEPSKEGVRTARQAFGIRLQQTAAEDHHFEKRYDIVAARHVLEHLQNPPICLKKILDDGLKPNGILMLKLPRFDSWEAKFFGKFWHGYDLPRHRFHFSKQGISLILERAGYRDIRVYSEAVGTDILRSLKYRFFYGPGKLMKYLLCFIIFLPKPVQLVLAQAVSVILSPLGAGRMIVTARKP